VIPLIVLASTFGAANASIFTGSRVSYVSAKHGHAPGFLGKLHAKFDTPVNALILQALLAVIFVSAGSFSTLVNFYSVIAWIFYLLAVCGLLVLRWTDPITYRPFRVWLPVPVIFCGATVFLIVFSVMEAPFEAVSALGFMFLGIPAWWIVVYRRTPWEGTLIIFTIGISLVYHFNSNVDAHF
jgi:amino acid transporter